MCEEAHPILLEKMEFPEPVISIAIEPKTKADQEKLGSALQRLAVEDPSFHIQMNEDTGQTLISGMGELHLEIIVDRMRREFKVEANVGQPQVSYKETISEKAVGEGKFIRQSGGKGQYGHCVIRLEPLPGMRITASVKRTNIFWNVGLIQSNRHFCTPFGLILKPCVRHS